MGNNALDEYLKAIHDMFSGGDAREESYYTSLETLIKRMWKLYHKQKKKAPHVVIMPKRTDAGNPDLVVKDDSLRLLGYIEAKAPLKDLDQAEKSEQVRRYLEVFPNFILTDFLEFRLFRNGGKVLTVSVANPATFLIPGLTPPTINKRKCLELFRLFFSFKFPFYGDMEWLAGELAKRTRFMKDYVILEELRKGPELKNGRRNHIHGFYDAFKEYLNHHLTEEQFVDLYSQTLTFGLFTAATRDRLQCDPANIKQCIPPPNGILSDIFQFITGGEMPDQLECCIQDIIGILGSVNPHYISNAYHKNNRGGEPVLHFYETFLSRYDPALREKKGVYYTPLSVVRFIVRSIHWILKEKLGKSCGLADRDIFILDPAAGTSTFLAEVVRLAKETYSEKYGEGAGSQLTHSYLIKNIYGFEELMAPYAVGHLKMHFMLERMDIKLKGHERFNLYLTNTLEMEDIEQSNLPGMSSLSHESRSAGRIKKETPVTVVLGNPPYAGHSANRSGADSWIGRQVETYKQVNGQALGEKNPKWLQDDYVKFIRFAQYTIDRNPQGEGVIGYITNHGYLDNPTFRGLRRSLMDSFDEIYILDLHGNMMKKEKSPDGSVDENVFDIRQGVAIGFFIKIKNKGKRKKCRVFHIDLWGFRKDKYEYLESNIISTIQWQEIHPVADFYLFTPVRQPDAKHYASFFKITDIFPLHSVGIVTARDRLTIRDNEEEMYRTVTEFAAADETLARQSYQLGDDTRDWQVKQAQADLLDSGLQRKHIVPILYRPFDIRYTYYTGRSRGFLCMPRPEVMRHMLKENIGLVTVRQVAEGVFNHCMVADTIIESRVTSSNRGIAYLFPLYFYLLQSDVLKQANISPALLRSLTGTPGFPSTLAPELVFYYIYAVLFSTIYRETYADGLKIDFPRIPFTADFDLFLELAQSGERLSGLHRMRSAELDQSYALFEEKGNNLVKTLHHRADQSRLYINETQYFSHIHREVWQYQQCGYPVLKKWLKNRKGKSLESADILHVIKMANAIRLTLECQQEIDRLYPPVEKKIISVG
jgi:predicted helicase